MGNLRVGDPVFTTALRGDVACIVKVSTLQHPLHSGIFGGPTPGAMVALARLLATLHDDTGDVAVEGVTTGSWPGEQFSEEDLRASADVLEGVTLTGSGEMGDRLWAHPRTILRKLSVHTSRRARMASDHLPLVAELEF